MKRIFVILVIIATTYAALLSEEYLPPLEHAAPTSNLDLQALGEYSSLSDDGYHYKTIKQLRLRHRRDVSELPTIEYLPPPQSVPAIADIPVVINTPIETGVDQNTAVLADDGYHYKAVKRVRYRHRRDVNELPVNEYLPPINEEAFPNFDSAPLDYDGYRYKTVKRVVYKHRV